MLAAAFAAGGEMGERLASFDWSSSPLGEPGQWPPALSTAVGMMLASSAPIVMFWGDEQLAFYNDAYRPTIGGKHPDVIGQPARAYWAETWAVLGPLLDGVRSTGRSYRGEDHPFLLDRHGFVEQTYFDVSYDPIRGDDGCGQWRLLHRQRDHRAGARRTPAAGALRTGRRAEPTSAAPRNWAGSPPGCSTGTGRTCPFALIYLADDDGQLTLAGRTGADPARPSMSPRSCSPG